MRNQNKKPKTKQGVDTEEDGEPKERAFPKASEKVRQEDGANSGPQGLWLLPGHQVKWGLIIDHRSFYRFANNNLLLQPKIQGEYFSLNLTVSVWTIWPVWKCSPLTWSIFLPQYFSFLHLFYRSSSQPLSPRLCSPCLLNIGVAPNYIWSIYLWLVFVFWFLTTVSQWLRGISTWISSPHSVVNVS